MALRELREALGELHMALRDLRTALGELRVGLGWLTYLTLPGRRGHCVPYDPAQRVAAKLPGRRGHFVPYDPALGVAAIWGGSQAAGAAGALCALRPNPGGGSQLDARDSRVMHDKFNGGVEVVHKSRAVFA